MERIDLVKGYVDGLLDRGWVKEGANSYVNGSKKVTLIGGLDMQDNLSLDCKIDKGGELSFKTEVELAELAEKKDYSIFE